MAAKRVCKEESNWSNLPTELLELIVKRLSFKEMACFKAVCPSWNLAVRSYSSSLIPRLLISNTDQQQEDGEPFPSKIRKKQEGKSTNRDRFFSLIENKVFTVKKVFGRFNNSETILSLGSSRGWLVILNGKNINNQNLYLVNPFTGVEIRLPLLKTLISKSILYRENIIAKLILTSDPYSCSSDNFMVVVMHSYSQKLAFCNASSINGDKKWTQFLSYNESECHSKIYRDIIYHNGKLYALYDDTDDKVDGVEVWDLHDLDHDHRPTKVMTIGCTDSLEEWRQYRLDLYRLNMQCYKVWCHLVESSGEIFLVLRLIGKFDNMRHPGFITHRFPICKLDYSTQKWISIRSSSDRVKLIGEYKHCVESERFSTYNSDDYLISSMVCLD